MNLFQLMGAGGMQIKSVQTGEEIIGATLTEFTVSYGHSVNSGKTLILINQNHNGDDAACPVALSSQSSGGFTVEKNAKSDLVGYQTKIRWQAIEFAGNIRVHHAKRFIDPSTTTETTFNLTFVSAEADASECFLILDVVDFDRFRGTNDTYSGPSLGHTMVVFNHTTGVRATVDNGNPRGFRASGQLVEPL